MRGVMFVGIGITLIILSIKPSSAQQITDTGCLRRISSCLKLASHPAVCCPTFEAEIKNERDCFCLMKDGVLTDPQVAAGMARIFTLCGFTQSFLTVCSATGSSSSPPSMPSTPSPPSPTFTPAEISTSPPPAGPPLSTTPTVPMTNPPSTSPDIEDPPSAPISTSPEISISPPPVDGPSSPHENGTTNCFERISSCLKGASNFMECCQTLVEVVEYEKECLCPRKHVFLKDPKTASAFATVLSSCNVPDSLETICSGIGSTSLSPPSTVPMTLPPSASPDTINSTSNNGTASASTSGSTNKIAYSVGLLPSLLLIIWATLV